MTVRIRFRDDDKVFAQLLLDDRADVGPEIRQPKMADCDAATYQPIDVPIRHCPACACNASIADRIGLRSDEVERISQWRSAAKMNYVDRCAEALTAAELGAILDKIIAKLDDCPASCDNETHRIVVEVEPTP